VKAEAEGQAEEGGKKGGKQAVVGTVAMKGEKNAGLVEEGKAEGEEEEELGPADQILKDQKENGNVFTKTAKSRLQQQMEREQEEKKAKEAKLKEMRNRLKDEKSAKDMYLKKKELSEMAQVHK
jgi:hypothetical protein